MINYRNELITNILPFWLDHAMDTEHGGIMTCLDREGRIYGEEKRSASARLFNVDSQTV